MSDNDLWFKFYPDKWMNDMELSLCRASTQGVYITLLCVMHDSEPYGFLPETVTEPCRNCNGSVPKALRFRTETVSNALQELLENGVLKQDDQGGIYSERMLLERQKREQAQADGKRGYEAKTLKAGVKATLKPDIDIDIDIEEEGYKPLTPEVEKLIKSTAGIKGWKFTKAQDADFFTRLLADFPPTLISSVLEDLRTYQEKPAKQYKNLHSALRNWCKREKERQLPEDDEPKPQAPLDANGNPLMEIDGEQLTRHEFDRLRGAGEVIRKGDKWIRNNDED